MSIEKETLELISNNVEICLKENRKPTQEEIDKGWAKLDELFQHIRRKNPEMLEPGYLAKLITGVQPMTAPSKFKLKTAPEFDIEAELATILQEEIWKELTKETGKTKQDMDNEIIEALKTLRENENK